jgi:hypothetical protein
VREGLLLVRRYPIVLLAGLMMYFIAMLLLSEVPVLGQIIALLLVPASNLGFMETSRRATRGELPMPQYLITPFRISTQTTQRLFALGLVYLLVVIALLGITSLVDGGLLWSAMTGASSADDATVQQLMQSPAMAMFGMMLLPISVVFWYAPALIAWDAQPVMKALFMAFIASLRNWKALIVFALCWMFVILFCVQLIAAIALFASNNTLFARVAVMPLILILMTSVLACFYPIYRDTLQPAEVSPAVG